MSAARADAFEGWLLAAIGGAMDASQLSLDAAGSVQAELAKFAAAGSVQVVRACRNGGRVDAMLAGQAGSRGAVVAGLDGQDRVLSLWVQREPAAFTGVSGGLVVVLNGPSSSGKSTLATAIQQAAGTPWIRLRRPHRTARSRRPDRPPHRRPAGPGHAARRSTRWPSASGRGAWQCSREAARPTTTAPRYRLAAGPASSG